MEILSSYNPIIGASIIVILSFWFNGVSKKTNIPSVLMLIVLGIILQYVMGYFIPNMPNFDGALEILGIVGLIMIVLEAALELELKKEKIILKNHILYSLGRFVPWAFFMILSRIDNKF